MATKKTTQSSEDYLEAMLVLQQEHGYIRSIDVAAHLGVTKPSVSYATKHLRENGYITMGSDGLISFTDSGVKIAKKIYERHQVLTDLLVHLGVSPEVAREDACKVEHDLSDESFDALCNYAGKVRKHG